MVQEIVIEKVSIPKVLIDTTPLPAIPHIKMQSEAAEYTLKLWDSASTCKENMRAIDSFLK